MKQVAVTSLDKYEQRSGQFTSTYLLSAKELHNGMICNGKMNSNGYNISENILQ